MKKLSALLLATTHLLAACAAVPPPQDRLALEQEVRDAERAFARTMVVRDHAAFVSFLAEETVFFAGSKPLRGKREVAEAWKPFYTGPVAPFSWEPQQVQVLDSGTLALTSGPVHDPVGQAIGRFTSIWRREAPGVWRIVFDKGCEPCNCGKPGAAP